MRVIVHELLQRASLRRNFLMSQPSRGKSVLCYSVASQTFPASRFGRLAEGPTAWSRATSRLANVVGSAAPPLVGVWFFRFLVMRSSFREVRVRPHAASGGQGETGVDIRVY